MYASQPYITLIITQILQESHAESATVLNDKYVFVTAGLFQTTAAVHWLF